MTLKKEASLLRSFLEFSAGPWLASVISFLVTPITTYLIIPEEFGKASMYTVAFSLILQVVLLGTDQSFVRMFYEYDEEKAIPRFFILRSSVEKRSSTAITIVNERASIAIK